MAIRHGTTNGYTNHHCKCAACRSAWAAAYRIYRAKRRAKGLCMECSTQSQRSRCPHHLLLNAMRQAVQRAALKKERAMPQVTALAILLLLVVLSVACGDVRENMTGPSAITGAPTSGQLTMPQVTALAILLLLVVLSVACGDVRENMTGPSAITGAPTSGQLRQAPVEILDRAQRGRQ